LIHMVAGVLKSGKDVAVSHTFAPNTAMAPCFALAGRSGRWCASWTTGTSDASFDAAFRENPHERIRAANPLRKDLPAG
jgi:hypothetical protein